MTQPTTDNLLDELQRRVQQLQELNKVLAAEVDAQRAVVEAAQTWRNTGPEVPYEKDAYEAQEALVVAIDTYESSKTK